MLCLTCPPRARVVSLPRFDPRSGLHDLPPIRGVLESNREAARILSWVQRNVSYAKVLIPRSNAFGHKVSSILVAKRLVELGVSRVAIIPEDRSVAREVEGFLTMVDPTLRWDALARSAGQRVGAFLDVRRLPPGGLGFTGGFELPVERLQDTLKVDDAIVLQPPAWKSRCELSETHRAPEGHPLYHVFRSLRIELERSAYYCGAAFTPAEALSMHPRCQAIDESMFSPDVLMCPAYGLHHPSVKKPDALVCVVRAVGDLCRKFTKRGVVVAIRQGPADLEGADLGDAVVMADCRRREDIAKALHDQSNLGKVLVVCTGSLPPAIYDMLMATANLPYIFEGAGSLSLGLNLGKPYIRLCGNDMDENYYPTRWGLGERFRDDIARLDILGAYLARSPDTIQGNLCDYFEHCLADRRRSSAYFRELRKRYHQATRDKVFLSLALWHATKEPASISPTLMRDLRLVEAEVERTTGRQSVPEQD